MKPIYLDYNATTPIDSEVAEVMKYLIDEGFGNPSSTHYYGLQAKKAVEMARSQVAELIGCNYEEIIFTGCGTESNNLAIKGVAFANRHRGNHIITSQIEHPAVIEVCRYLERWGFEISYAGVDEYGLVNPKEIEQLINDRTILVSIMHANNETGTIQPIEEISVIIKGKGIVFHTDAAQSCGKIPLNINDLDVDLLTIAGHKLYAPKGIGGLYLRKGINLESLLHGASQEFDKRAGTENVIHIAAIGKACEIAYRDLSKNNNHFKRMRDRLEKQLLYQHLPIKINGHTEKRLPNTSSIGFSGISANQLLEAVPGVAASAGAACHSGETNISSVLKAMKVPFEYAAGTIRFSTGKFTTEEEIDLATQLISESYKQSRFDSASISISSHNTKIGQHYDLFTDLLNREKSPRLTQYTSSPGCSCKIPKADLQQLLSIFPPYSDAMIIVGNENSDDAAVYRIDDEKAIVQTIDVLTPMVDDPYTFGAIAAANSLGDIYAMGAKPLFALSFIGFPVNKLPREMMTKIVQGAVDKTAEAGIQIIGGHSIVDNELKFGLVVTGIAHPSKILTNSGAKTGNVLILTKPLGIGIITSASAKVLCGEKILKNAIEVMVELNKKAMEIALNFDIHSCTDITGFGLLGHLSEILEASGVSAEIYLNQIPVIPEASQLAKSGHIPGAAYTNLDYIKDFTEWDEKITQAEKLILCDPQTSGGLLLAVNEKQVNELLKKMVEAGLGSAKIIGRIVPNVKASIHVFR
jgi:cysteine desulfurase